MKKLIAGAALSTALAIGITGCAHQQLTNQQVARKAAVIGTVALLILASIGEQQAGPR